MGEVVHFTLIEKMGWYIQVRCSCSWWGHYESLEVAAQKAAAHRDGSQSAA